MERERRARINQSLGDLRVLVLQGLDIDVSKFYKLLYSNIHFSGTWPGIIHG